MDYHDKNLMDRTLPSLVFWNGRLIAERIFYNLNISLCERFSLSNVAAAACRTRLMSAAA